ncbi:MAG: hypothetical protein M3377_04020 [Actinomycetota bacterium]|nr:hypothetical protein [Actinomycetota bacterium]
MKKKRKTTVEKALPPEHREGYERSQRMLAERISYHEARIAAREREENPNAATA